MLPHRDRFSGRRHVADGAALLRAAAAAARRCRCAAATAAPTAAVGDHGRNHIDLGVLREALRAGHVDRAARPIEPIAGPKPPGEAVRVAHEEVGEIDEHAAVGLGGDREAPENRLRERVFDRLAFGRIRRIRAVIVVRLGHENLRTDALELHDARAAELRAIEADVVGAEARREPREVNQLLVEPSDLHEEGAGRFIPVERHEAIELLHAGRAIRDRRWPSAAATAAALPASGATLKTAYRHNRAGPGRPGTRVPRQHHQKLSLHGSLLRVQRHLTRTDPPATAGLKPCGYCGMANNPRRGA